MELQSSKQEDNLGVRTMGLNGLPFGRLDGIQRSLIQVLRLSFSNRVGEEMK